MPRLLLAALVALSVAVPAALLEASPTSAATSSVQVSIPSRAKPGRPMAITITLPGKVAAVDGRLLMEAGAAELIGVAPEGRGSGLRPVLVEGGAAFGAYGLKKIDGVRVLRLVVMPEVAGQLQLRVIVDATANRSGARVAVSGTYRTAGVRVGSAGRFLAAPAAIDRFLPSRPATAATESLPDGTIDVRDLDLVTAGWEATRDTGRTCQAGDEADINGDGCTDIVDVQLTAAAASEITAEPPPTGVGGRTFTVSSTADSPDAARGNGVCADSQGRCTLRAAMAEADFLAGQDRIEFALPGTAPVRIQLSGRLPVITSRTGGVVIDGYSQPGSRVNSATVGSDAIPGVEIRGNGNSAREVAFRVTGPGNVLRGLLINNVYRPIFFDGADASGNYVVGNLIGFNANRSNFSSTGNFGVVLNTGSHDNQIGTSDLADRNVIGNYTHAIENYGPGTDGNTIQNNVLCIAPNGITTAQCSVGIDHNFGPKNSLIGGTGLNERNYIGRTLFQCIEFSHGWDPALPWGSDTSTTYQINGHRVIGNWLGFRADGSYDANSRCGQNASNADNANGVNVYDGTYDNLVQGNYIGSVYDGVHVMAPNSQRNIVRGNTIGVSPQGQPAPMAMWGVRMRWRTKDNIVEDNIIRNAARGGVGLVEHTVFNVRISRNLVSDTSGPAIHLEPDPNGPGGANVLLAPPAITSAETDLVQGTGIPGATVEVFRASRDAGQSGLPAAYLGTTTVSSGGAWSVPVALQVDQRVTALQIRADQNTSTLSTNATVLDGGTPPPPPPPGVLAQDAFGRTLDVGWGDADLGGSWILSGNAGDLSVARGAGLISAGAGQARQARLGLSAVDVSITGRLSVDRLPGAGNLFGYIDARANGTTSYRGTIRVASSGAVFAQLRKSVNGAETAVLPEAPVPGVSAAGSAWLAFRFEVAGDTLRLRVWAGGDAEPSTWDTSATDATPGLGGPGTVGVRVYTGGPVPNGPVTFAWDDLQVNEAQPIEPPPPPESGDLVASDDFGRTVSGGWGAATLGGAWTQGGRAADLSVSGGRGHVSTARGVARQTRLPVDLQDVSVSGQVAFDRLPAGGNAFAYIDTRVNGKDAYRGTIRVNSAGAVFAQLRRMVGGLESAIQAGVQVPGVTAAGAAPLAYRFEVVGSTVRLRVWTAGDAEPSTWNTSANDSTAALQGSGRIGIRAYAGKPVSNGPITTSWDDLEVRLP